MFKHKYSILLVEDENCARKLLGNRMSKMPQVSLAGSVPNGLSAKKYLCEHVVDVVFTDIQMPLMNGVELAAFVKEFMPQCQVVFISGHEEFEYARKGIQYGVKEYLSKPINFTEIVETAKRCFQTVDKRREDLLVPHYHAYKELEQQIAKTLTSGQEPDRWCERLEQLIVQSATLVCIEQTEYCERGKDELAMVYRNILCDVLSGQIVLQLGVLQDKWYYLIVERQDETHQLLKGIPEYLERILKQPVHWSEISRINSAKELIAVFESLKKDDRNALIENACRYMEMNLGKAITRDEVAESVWLSPSYFSLLFKKVKGVGYNEYLTELRVTKAKEMLKKNVSVSNIAKSVGFCDARYFSNIFHKKTGYTPSEYRRALLNGEIAQKEAL